MRKPELLAPAGSLEIVKYAISAGADAVYCAGKIFGARAFAVNLTNLEIIEAAKYVHLRFKKIYITVNTIIFEEEFAELKEYIDFLYQHVDGIIVQDLGVFHYVRRTYPDFPVHMSTQCNIHNLTDALFYKELGSTRLVLARETPLEVVKDIIATGIEVELFVHGALCFCYSGNCYMSAFIGGRSGNRGSCAQPCRKNYTLLEDNEEIAKGPILSMKDLMTLKNIPTLCDLGVASFKIEGRMKSKEYVVSSVKAYRKAIDDWYNNKKFTEDVVLKKQMLVTFNREFTDGYLFKAHNNEVTTKKGVNHQGILIGKVISSTDKQADIKLTDTLNINDGIRIGNTGQIVTRIFLNRKMVKSANNQIITIDIKQRVKKGDDVLKTLDSELIKEYDHLLDNHDFDTLVQGRLYLFKNKISFEIRNKFVKVIESMDVDLECAIKEVNYVRLKEQMMKVNNLPIKYQKFDITKDQDYFIPIPLLNELRNKALDKYQEECFKIKTRINIPYIIRNIKTTKSKTKYKFLCRTDIQESYLKNKKLDIYQLEEHNPRICYDINGYKEFAEHVSEIGIKSDISPFLNAANAEAISFMRMFTKGTIYLSIELDKNNLELLSKIDKNLGIVAYSKMPLMISNHCPVASSKGYPNKHCGECLKHKYDIMDDYHNKMHLYFENCIMYILGFKALNRFEDIKKDPIYGSFKYLIDLYDEDESSLDELIINI